MQNNGKEMQKKVCCTCKVFCLLIRKKVCCTCKHLLGLIRSIVVIFYHSRCLHLVFRITRFYILFEEAIISERELRFQSWLNLYITYKFLPGESDPPSDCCGNYEYSNYQLCSLYNRHYFLFIIRGCYIPFQFTLVTALYYFHEIHQTTSSPPFFLRDSRASETRAPVKITPREKRRHGVLSPRRVSPFLAWDDFHVG